MGETFPVFLSPFPCFSKGERNVLSDCWGLENEFNTLGSKPRGLSHCCECGPACREAAVWSGLHHVCPVEGGLQRSPELRARMPKSASCRGNVLVSSHRCRAKATLTCHLSLFPVSYFLLYWLQTSEWRQVYYLLPHSRTLKTPEKIFSKRMIKIIWG